MTVLPITIWGEPVLHRRAAEVAAFDDELRTLIADTAYKWIFHHPAQKPLADVTLEPRGRRVMQIGFLGDRSGDGDGDGPTR